MDTPQTSNPTVSAPRIERVRHELRTETDAERRRGGLQPRAQRRDLDLEKRIVGRVVDANRRAEDDEQIGIGVARRRQRIEADVEITNRVAGVGDRRREHAEIFKMHVTDDESGTHGMKDTRADVPARGGNCSRLEQPRLRRPRRPSIVEHRAATDRRRHAALVRDRRVNVRVR